jgi:glycosyltransferase involved in cell wall biosynthesis
VTTPPWPGPRPEWRPGWSSSPVGPTWPDLPPNVEVRLDLSYPEIRTLYEGASCVVLPTFGESHRVGSDCSGQICLLDAWAMARPVVATDRSTLADYVEPGAHALLVPPGDPDRLRQGMEAVLGDRGLARRVADAGRQRMTERHTTRMFAQRLAPVLRDVARGAG